MMVVTLSACSALETKDGDSSDRWGKLDGHNPQEVIVSESDQYNFDYIVTDMNGGRARGQVFDDGETTYFVWPDGGDIASLQDASGAARESRREGRYRATTAVESMWFAKTESGQSICIRAGWMGESACGDAVEASRDQRPSEEALLQRREELLQRLNEIENSNDGHKE
ncbi:hypothetical protein [Thioalkalivibrio sp. K90mix]|uniref:hypothetical protein n=1 Tax=Thioalkalivibrio sp. (strain K90mix) TaxID=396595 RepID=UPI0003788FC4|nr:hypothetical protein [Thioalkalivibrio sp. K90mix]